MDLSITASVLSELFPYGWVDVVMWTTMPLWLWTFWTQDKKDRYWIFSLYVCFMWALFDIYIKSWPGATLNIAALIALAAGYRRYKDGQKSTID